MAMMLKVQFDNCSVSFSLVALNEIETIWSFLKMWTSDVKQGCWTVSTKNAQSHFWRHLMQMSSWWISHTLFLIIHVCIFQLVNEERFWMPVKSCLVILLDLVGDIFVVFSIAYHEIRTLNFCIKSIDFSTKFNYYMFNLFPENCLNQREEFPKFLPMGKYEVGRSKIL